MISAVLNNSRTYTDFIARKSHTLNQLGFEPLWLPDWLFDFQLLLVEWSIRLGRPLIAADCGLGKTPMQLVWAENVVRKTNRPVLILTPLGVAAQTVREAEKFGIKCLRAWSRDDIQGPCIYVTNYERLHLFDSDDFSGVVCDESSILKNFMGVRRKAVTEFLKKLPYRLLCTATAAPNDYIELGTSSEALGQLGHMDMLARFFKNDDKTLFLHGTKYGDMTQKGWRFKAHAEEPFWRWVCSWARAIRKPSDLDCDDAPFVLPELVTRQHTVTPLRLAPGFLFPVQAATLAEQREEERRSVPERCERVAELVDHNRPAVAWCHLNAEGALLERLISGAKQVSGSDSDEAKEETFAAFVSGEIRVLVSKPKIAGYGLNWQHCAHQTFFPSHSFEQWYQCVRRSLRFGQLFPVCVDIVSTEGAASVMENLHRKSRAADQMFSNLVSYMTRFQTVERMPCGWNRLETPAWL